MQPRRTGRLRRPTTRWEAEIAVLAAPERKKIEKGAQTVEKSVLELVQPESVPLAATVTSNPLYDAHILLQSIETASIYPKTSATASKAKKKAPKALETKKPNPKVVPPDLTCSTNTTPSALENQPITTFIGPKTISEAGGAPPAASDPVITRETDRTTPETAFVPVATRRFPPNLRLSSGDLPLFSDYSPPLKFEERQPKSLVSHLQPLEIFQLLFTPEIVDQIVESTNSYAADAESRAALIPNLDSSLPSDRRLWKPVCAVDIWRYLGCRIYMGQHRVRLRESYWGENERLSGVFGKTRFEQIHRYITLRDAERSPRQPGECFAWRVEPIASQIRKNTQKVWIPGSHLAIDESMVRFKGRSFDKVKLPNKPIKEGYKIWAHGCKGYIDDWLWHSRKEGPEESITSEEFDRLTDGQIQKFRFAPTFALILRLAMRLRQRYPEPAFCYFLDNLFLNVDVAQALLAMGISCCGTTRKNAAGVPTWLLDLKNNNRGVVWNSAFGEVIEQTLCWAWQDNNMVIGITTAYQIKNETAYVLRKRPAPTSTNAAIVRPVFGDCARKWLHIPLAIDDYNHHMNGIDRANQLRANMTVHRPYEKRIWRPLFSWLIDLCCTNAWWLSNPNPIQRKKGGQGRFLKILVEELLNTPYPAPPPPKRSTNQMPPPTQLGPISSGTAHIWVSLPSRRHCVWCKEHRDTWKAKRPAVQGPQRQALQEMMNGVVQQPAIRASKSSGGCATCKVWLCQRGGCFFRYHST